jgi:hypothetical protein
VPVRIGGSADLLPIPRARRSPLRGLGRRSEQAVLLGEAASGGARMHSSLAVDRP